MLPGPSAYLATLKDLSTDSDVLLLSSSLPAPSTLSLSLFLVLYRFKYKYDEFKLIIEGTICIKEPSTGTQIEAKVGDVVNISKGADLVL